MVTYSYHRDRAWVIFLLYAGLVVFLSHQPGNPYYIPPFPHFDKFQHFVEYFVFGVFFQRALLFTYPEKNWPRLMVIAAILFAVTDEFHQSFIPFRSADVYDLCADSTGILGSLSCYRFLQRYAKNKSS